MPKVRFLGHHFHTEVELDVNFRKSATQVLSTFVTLILYFLFQIFLKYVYCLNICREPFNAIKL